MKIIPVILFAVILSSCKVYKPLSAPYPGLKKGDRINLVLTNGVKIDKLEVKEVWRDSLLLGSSTKALKFSEIKEIQKKKFSPVLTASIALPFIILSGTKMTFGPFGHP